MHPYIHARSQSRQTGDRDRGHRRDDQLSATGRALEPGRAPAALVGPEARRCDRGVHGESSALPGNLVGEPALRHVPRMHLVESHRSGGAVHHRRLRCEAVRHVIAHGGARGTACAAVAGTTALHGRRCRRAVSFVGARSRCHADDADRRREHRRRHVVFVRHDRPAERHQGAAADRAHRCAERAGATREQVLLAAPRLDLSFAGAAVSRSAVALVHDRQLRRRHGRADGSLRAGAGARPDRALQSDARAVGPDAFRAHAAATARKCGHATTCRR